MSEEEKKKRGKKVASTKHSLFGVALPGMHKDLFFFLLSPPPPLGVGALVRPPQVLETDSAYQQRRRKKKEEEGEEEEEEDEDEDEDEE